MEEDKKVSEETKIKLQEANPYSKVRENDDDLSKDPVYVDLWSMVEEITNHPEIKKLNLELNLESSISVGYILASVLPLRPQEKQTILEFEDPRDKLDYLKEIIQ